MGVYLVSVGAEEWFGGEEDGQGQIAAALNDALRQRGLPAYESVPEEQGFVRDSGQAFEEKLSSPIDGFEALCEAHLSQEETETLSGWSVLVPFSLDEEIRLPVGCAYSESTVVAGAPQVLALAKRLAAAIELPAETPRMCDNLDLTMWFMDGAAKELAASRPAPEPWGSDLSTAFYVALFLRAAEHAMRRGCPLVYC
ncbi:hypothetical protein [Streptomyces sp. NPDC059651]|uniref:hypothetical protein n=1 Tax=unclassified Streptomyces TaxID=2593676 RepID=UPI0036CF80F8